jgi:hypothetical protein
MLGSPFATSRPPPQYSYPWGLSGEGLVGGIAEARIEDWGVAYKVVNLGCASLVEALGN